MTTNIPPPAKQEIKKDAKKDAKKEAESELSEEDQALKTQLESLVESLQQKVTQPTLQEIGIAIIHNSAIHIKTATSSMTSVPKPLKFLRPHYEALKLVWEKLSASTEKKLLADILSVLAMTYSDNHKHETLAFRLVGSPTPPAEWGHEYIRHLCLEIITAFPTSTDPSALTDLGVSLLPFLMSHNAEADAVDLLIELEQLPLLPKFVDKNTFARACLYVLSCTPYAAPPDDVVGLRTVHEIYVSMGRWSEAFNVAIKLRDLALISSDFTACVDVIEKKQLAFQLARAGIMLECDDAVLTDIMSNTQLSHHFLALARDLDVVDPKSSEDIYKSHLESGRIPLKFDSARHNLAGTFVNGFVNAAFTNDKLMVAGCFNKLTTDGNLWIYKNKEHGMMSAVASLGLLFLWSVDTGLPVIDKYLYSTEDFVVAGALMAIGLVTCGVRNESEPALALLSDYVENPKLVLRSAAIFGLGIAYSGSNNDAVHELLAPLVIDSSLSMELAGLAALSLGHVGVGSCHDDLTSSILQTMMERTDTELKDPFAKFMGLGLALLFVGRQDGADATLETLKAISHPLARQTAVLVEACAYAGTGNVLKIQNMLHYCNDHLDPEKEDDTFQAFAVLGIALVAMGEDIGSEMAQRSLNHIMHYGEAVTRRAVPLALGLLCTSNPLVHVMDVLSKYSHDHDSAVAQSAIFSMGLVGAGTNNARIAQMLRQLAAYYAKDATTLFSVRIAQGLLHMGKGTLGLNPFYCNKTLMSPAAVGGLVTTLVALVDSVLGSHHYFLYYLVPAIFPRFLITLNDALDPIATTVRVGQAVDTVGQAGRPKTITGFQTHTSPVLLAYTERAELASDEYLACTGVLEGFVLLKKNPEWVDPVEAK